jgi:hypothetical protein
VPKECNPTRKYGRQQQIPQEPRLPRGRLRISSNEWMELCNFTRTSEQSQRFQLSGEIAD